MDKRHEFVYIDIDMVEVKMVSPYPLDEFLFARIVIERSGVVPVDEEVAVLLPLRFGFR